MPSGLWPGGCTVCPRLRPKECCGRLVRLENPRPPSGGSHNFARSPGLSGSPLPWRFLLSVPERGQTQKGRPQGMTTKKPHPVDIHVGQKLRELRCHASLSQSALGAGIGVTFQQLQKYRIRSQPRFRVPPVGAGRAAQCARRELLSRAAVKTPIPCMAGRSGLCPMGPALPRHPGRQPEASCKDREDAGNRTVVICAAVQFMVMWQREQTHTLSYNGVFFKSGFTFCLLRYSRRF